jgi:NADH dehydrogenase FAD-containing subunit/uncharacterized membrane protein YphA (DoxX/SURF4 family)
VSERVRARVVLILALIGRGLRWAAPFVDLWVRICLAKAFFVSGMLKIGNWPVALELARTEYPVAWLAPQTAAVWGATLETLGPILLVMGFLVRPAACALLLLSLVIQFAYQPLDLNLFWAALCGWYVVYGAGPLSLDHAVAKGLKSSALPLAGPTINAAAWFARRAGPWYQIGLRLWLAAALVGIEARTEFFPVATTASVPKAIALPAALLLATGSGTPAVAGILLVTLSVVWAMAPQEGVTLYAPLVLALLTVFGAGRYSLDCVVLQALRRRTATTLHDLPHIVIVGGGFGGMACASKLRNERARLTLIDRHNYHLFQPLLYQVATANLSPADIATPIRAVFRDDPRVSVLCGTVTGVDPVRQRVLVEDRELSYDYLVLATGASHGYFGNDRWATYAPGLKFVEDAVAIRGRILTAFEKAEASDDAAERERQLTFLICGGGPTGVELAGAIAELAHQGLESEFRRFDPADARIILVQSAPRILPAFPEKLSAFALTSLQRLGVDVRVGSRVQAIDQVGAVVNGTRIPAATVLWAAGVVASPAADWLGQPHDSAGRLKVSSDLSVPGYPNVFAIGDTATVTAWNGLPVPGLAPAAQQAGKYVAALLRSRLQLKDAPPPFEYRHQGSLATIGRKTAVADFGWITLSGAAAWWVWGAVHILFLVGLRNRISVMVGWLWSYLTYRVGVQLITGAGTDRLERAVSRAPAGEAPK